MNTTTLFIVVIAILFLIIILVIYEAAQKAKADAAFQQQLLAIKSGTSSGDGSFAQSLLTLIPSLIPLFIKK